MCGAPSMVTGDNRMWPTIRPRLASLLAGVCATMATVAASVQFVRKLSGFTSPSKANEAAFDGAVDEVADVAQRLLDSLVTSSAPRDREAVAAKARERAARRFSPVA